MAQKLKLDEDCGDGASAAKKRRKQGGRTAVKPTVAESFQTADLRGVTVKGKAFVGKEFVIINGTKEKRKEELEKGVAEQRGTLAAHPGAYFFYAP